MASHGEMLDGSRGTPSLENRLPIPKHWENVKEFGISWRKRWITQKAFFLGKRKLLAGARGKTSLEERFSISKWWFSGQRVWYSWMALGAKLLL